MLDMPVNVNCFFMLVFVTFVYLEFLKLKPSAASDIAIKEGGQL